MSPACRRIFFVQSSLLIASVASNGLGDYLFGYNIGTNFSTLLVGMLLFIQLLTRTLRFPKVIFFIASYIFLQTFILNALTILDLKSSLVHFLGLLIFALALFSYVGSFALNQLSIIHWYFKFSTFVAAIGVLQVVFLVLFNVAFVPIQYISGNPALDFKTAFRAEIFDVLPRAVGLSTEPATYAIMLLPAVYVAIIRLGGKGRDFHRISKASSMVVLLGFILSFSAVGYFGMLLSLVLIYRGEFSKSASKKVYFSMVFITIVTVLASTNIATKFTPLPSMVSNATSYEYTSSDLSGFALVSNLLVANQALAKSNFLGTGLNTHKETYSSTIGQLFDPSQVVMELNSVDAGSLFIRILSEFGIPGLFGFFFFIVKFRRTDGLNSPHLKTINSICLAMILGYCSRNGAYISNVLLLFFALYYYSHFLGSKLDRDLVKKEQGIRMSA